MPSLAPYLTVSDAAQAIDFYKQVFGASERDRLEDKSGKIAHAEMLIGTDLLMLADEHPNFGALGPNSVGGTPVKFQVLVDDVDQVFAQAIEAGGTELRPVKDQFHGNRSGLMQDPWGHQWFIQTPTEAVSPEEIQRRWAEFA